MRIISPIISVKERVTRVTRGLCGPGGLDGTKEPLARVFAPLCVCAKLLRSCPTLCDLMYCNPPGSSVHGILQARILELH